MNSPVPAITTIECESARDVLEAISSHGRCFESEPPDSTWIFRGHAHDQYLLLPSCLRREQTAELHSLAQTPKEIGELAESNVCQAIAECTLLVRLYEELDKQGVAIPQDSAEIRSLLQIRMDQLVQCASDAKVQKSMPLWPLMELVPLMAFAQHHGLLTRLLDWTRSPFVAAYFAAAPEKSSIVGGQAEVWALNSVRAKWGRALGTSVEDQVFAVTAPRSSNPNLHAQDGLFTLHVPWNPQTRGPIDRRPVDEIVNGIDRELLGLSNAPLMYRVKFPRLIARELLWWLAKDGITAGRLFPGPAGAIQSLKERIIRQEPKTRI